MFHEGMILITSPSTPSYMNQYANLTLSTFRLPFQFWNGGRLTFGHPSYLCLSAGRLLRLLNAKTSFKSIAVVLLSLVPVGNPCSKSLGF